MDITETKHNPEKETTQNTAKQNCPGLVDFYDIQPGNDWLIEQCFTSLQHSIGYTGIEMHR